MLQSTVKLDAIQSPEFYDCIFIPGGHGPMYDLATSELLASILSKAAAAGACGAHVVPPRSADHAGSIRKWQRVGDDIRGCGCACVWQG